MNEDYKKLLSDMFHKYSTMYMVVETKYTKHHIEKLLASQKDRGAIKWIAETNYSAFDAKNDEAIRSTVDNCDYFPRVYFHFDSFFVEFFTWLQIRKLEVINIKTPKI